MTCWSRPCTRRRTTRCSSSSASSTFPAVLRPARPRRRSRSSSCAGCSHAAVLPRYERPAGWLFSRVGVGRVAEVDAGGGEVDPFLLQGLLDHAVGEARWVSLAGEEAG